MTETSTIYGRLKKSQAFSLLLWMPEPRVWAAPGTCNPSLPELLYSLWAYSCHNQPTLRCQKKLPCETGCSYAEDVALHTKNHRRNFLGFSTRKSYASNQLAAFCTGCWETQSQTWSCSPDCQMSCVLRTWFANLIAGLILISLSLFSWFSHLKHRHNPDSLVKNVLKWVKNKSLFSVYFRKDGFQNFYSLIENLKQ